MEDRRGSSAIRPSKSTSDEVIPVSKALTREKPAPYLEAKPRRADTETTQCPVQNKEKRLIFAPFHIREELPLNQLSQSHPLCCSLKVLIGLPAKGGVCIRNADDTVKSSGPGHLDDVNKPKWITYFSLSSIYAFNTKKKQREKLNISSNQASM